MSAATIEHDRRKIRRNRVLKAALVVLDDCSTFDCGVRNLSDSGACLEMGSTVGVPEVFKLRFDSARTYRTCRAIWRTMNKIGVSFE